MQLYMYNEQPVNLYPDVSLLPDTHAYTARVASYKTESFGFLEGTIFQGVSDQQVLTNRLFKNRLRACDKFCLRFKSIGDVDQKSYHL